MSIKLYQKDFNIEEASSNDFVNELEVEKSSENSYDIKLSASPRFGGNFEVQVSLVRVDDIVGLEKDKDTPRFSKLEEIFQLTPIKPSQEQIYEMAKTLQIIKHPVYGRKRINEIAKEIEREERGEVKTDRVRDEARENNYEIVSATVKNLPIELWVLDDDGIQMSRYKQDEVATEEILKEVGKYF